MAELNQQQVVDYIKGISVLELSQLVKALEQELGVSAAAAMPVAVAGAPAAGGAAAPVEEKTDFTAILKQYGVSVKVRKRKGSNIDAACGQLRRQELTLVPTP